MAMHIPTLKRQPQPQAITSSGSDVRRHARRDKGDGWDDVIARVNAGEGGRLVVKSNHGWDEVVAQVNAANGF